jgi:hypothetical protein
MVLSALQPVIEKLDPKPEISYPSSSPTLVVAYKSQMYKIHGRSMTGEISPNAHDEIGPSYRGFVLRVHLQDKGEVNQGITPQTLREPYWQTDLDVTPLAATQKQILWGLSCGVQTDTNLLTKIKRALHELKNAEPNGPTNGSQPLRSETNQTSSTAGSRR